MADVTLFFSLFSTLLAIINPLEAIPVFLSLMDGKGDDERRATARKACFNVLMLCLFFLVFGNVLLRLFGVPLSMVRVVGGVILMRIGFDLFSPGKDSMVSGGGGSGGDVSFIPLAMPIMFGPGVIATVIGLTSLVRKSDHLVVSFGVVVAAIVAAVLCTYVSLVYAKRILSRIGPQGVDAATRIVGFFVSAMGGGLIFHGTVEFLQSYGVLLGGPAAG